MHRIQKKITAALMVFAFTLLFSVSAFAEDPTAADPSAADPTAAAPAGAASGIDQTIDEVIGWNDITTDVEDMLNEGFNLVYGVIDDLTSGGSNDLKSIFYMAKGIGVLIMTLCLVIDVAARDMSATFGKPTLEMLFKPFIRYLAALIFILYLERFLQLILLLSQWCVYQIDIPAPTALTIPGYKEAIKTALGYTDNPNGPLDLIKNALASAQLYITFLLPMLVSKLAFIGTSWVIYSRTVNIIVSALAAPLGMPDLFSEKPIRDTRAFVYIRRFAGLCFQAVVIMLVCLALNLLTGELLTELINGLGASAGATATIAELSTLSLKLSCFKLVELGVLMGSANKAKELMGGS